MLAFQHDLLLREPADAVPPTGWHGLEPFHAMDSRDACLPAVHAALDSGIWRVSTWLDSLRVRMLTPDEILRHDPQQPAFSNVNTPDDFAEAEQIAREVGGL
ncbi:MAG: hypothetical protein M1434_14915 [Chloroflexi bacterium]|nr:hypothetical protein [Chloroflexota bacterium]MCL5276011.1 hypothetical protein [Chloroflexota bacterium]